MYENDNTYHILNAERTKINDIIKLLNRNGFKIPLLLEWREFVANKYPNLLTDNKRYVSGVVLRESLGEEKLNDLRIEYIYLINEHVRNIINNIDTDKAKKIVLREKAKIHSYHDIFTNNGFICYVKQRVFEIDMSKSLEVIMYKLIFEWYEMSEERRELYRKAAQLHYDMSTKNFNLNTKEKIDIEIADFDDESDE